MNRGYAVSLLRHYATSRTVVVSIPYMVIEISHSFIPSGGILALESTQPSNRCEYHAYLLGWGEKRWPVLRPDYLTT